MNEPIEAVVFDLDDTLLHDDRTISPYTVAVMRRAAERGIRVIPASGRAQMSMLPFVRQLDCAACYIACNGGEIWHGDGRLMTRHLFPQAVAERIIAFGAEHGCYMQTYYGDRFYFNEESEYARAYAASSMLQGTCTPELPAFIAAHPSSKVLMMAEADKVAAMLKEAQPLFAGDASVTCSKPWFLEFNPPKANKGEAVAACAEAYGFDIRRTVAFGDSINDLSMLRRVGMGVAVANARPDVREQVSIICGSNEEDGPARYVAAHALGEEVAAP